MGRTDQAAVDWNPRTLGLTIRFRLGLGIPRDSAKSLRSAEKNNGGHRRRKERGRLEAFATVVNHLEH